MKLIDVLKARSARNGVEALRIERQHVLKPLQRVERDESGDREGDHRDRVSEPALFARLIDAGEAIEAALDRPHDRREEIAFARVNARDEAAQRYGGCEHEREDDRDLRPADDMSWRHLRVRNSVRARSEFFGMDQRVEEIEAEADPDDQVR